MYGLDESQKWKDPKNEIANCYNASGEFADVEKHNFK